MAKRPQLFVFSNSAISADGKISTVANAHLALGSQEDRRRMSVLRARADAVFVGGRTFRNWPFPLREDPRHLDVPPRRDRPVINAVLTRRGVADTEVPRGRWPDPDVRLVVFGPESLDVEAHRERLGAEVEVTRKPTVSWVLDRLAARGCRRVLVEGGGDLIFQVVEAGHLDEFNLTVCPHLIGGARAPTPADGRGFAAADITRLKLVNCERIGDEVFLCYRVASRESSKALH